MADDGHGHPVEAGDAAQNGPVLPALTVAALLKEVGEQGVDGFVDVGTLGMASVRRFVIAIMR